MEEEKPIYYLKLLVERVEKIEEFLIKKTRGFKIK